MQIHIQRESRSHMVLVACMFSLLITATIANTLTAHADSIPGGNVSDPVVRAVDIARPAIVRIITSINGHLDVQFPSGQTVTFPQGGQGYQEQLSGTGTFITSNGDILTADHVVSPPPQVLQDAAAQDVATYISQHPNTGLQAASATQVDQALATNQLKSTAHYDQKSSEVFLSTDYTGPLTATTLSVVPSTMHGPVDKIEKESPFDQMDVAVIHAPFQDTPSVQLGDSSNVQPQDSLRIIGFPGNADVNALPQNLFTSSVNDITVSSIKTTQGGAPLIQVGGNVEHGDSGGPALDSQGNVVGIVSFGLSSANSPGSTSFLQASNSARGLITSLNLSSTPGTFQKLWSKAFTNYSSNAAGHWHLTQQEFQQLATSYPQFKAITPYQTYAQNQAKAEKVPAAQVTHNSASPSSNAKATSWKSITLTVGVIAGIVLLVISLFAVAIRGRERKKKAPVPPGGQQASAQPQNFRPGYPVTPPALGPINNNRAASVAPPRGPQQPGSVQRQPGPIQTPPGQVFPGRPAPGQPAGGLAQGPGAQNTAQQETLRPWPCGHMNRLNARFCSVCGELAPQPPTIRRVEQ
ncbi:MAG: trypsin-like peptidase domain-containing protein [Ktedonobacteraceae bacterium]|nr:trypsin-like peptidase domain-containing protein [Ktedonobacteraceae bacterium]